jgi:D-glycero-D-manno-heptose 1,7-bisphosphate phosphatase
MNKAAFIDRDGVINEDREYVYRSAEFKFIPRSIAALRTLRAAGFLLVVVTNQSGIARGLFSEADYHELETYMRACLSQAGVALDSVQYCPQQYRLDCECRKPRAGMIRAAAEQLQIDPSRSILIGDRKADIEAGHAAGVGRCFLVRSGKPLLPGDVLLADGVYADLAQCVGHLLRSDG